MATALGRQPTPQDRSIVLGMGFRMNAAKTKKLRQAARLLARNFKVTAALRIADWGR
jgi:hypothetical protein